MSLKILLVEDNAEHAELVRRALLGCADTVAFHSVETVKGARDLMDVLCPNLVLADLRLPDGTALDLLPGSLDEVERPLLVMTGQGDEHFAVACMKAGAVDYLVKSVETLASLPYLVQRALRDWNLILEHRRAIRALRESEERYRTLIENVPGAVFRSCVDMPAPMLHVSAGVEGLTGYEAEALLSGGQCTWEDIILEEDRPRAEAEIRRAVAEHLQYAVEYRIRTKDGRVRHVHDRGLCSYASDGSPRWIDGVIIDVTDRKEFEQALRESEERLRLAMEAANAGLWDWDASSNRFYLSPAAYGILGYAPGEARLGSDSYMEWVHPEDRKRVREDFERRLLDAGAFEIEMRMRCRDGGYRWVSNHAKVFSRSPDGAPLRIVGTLVDIDQRVSFERRLQENNERMNALFERANDAIFIADPATGLILEVNHRAELLLGRPRKELLGLALAELAPQELRADFRRKFAEAGSSDGKTLVDSEVESRERGRVPVEINSSLVALQGEKKVVQCLYRDVSERRQLEAQLRQAQKMDAIGQLAGGVAHDFNNVLAAIMLQIGILQDDKRIPADMHATLSLLQSSTNRAADLTRQLLLFGRRQPVKRQELDVDVLVSNLLKMLRRIIGETILLEFAPQPNAHWTYADPGMIEQVVMNLVVNARDAMPKGGRMILSTSLAEGALPAVWSDTPAAREGEGGKYVCIAVTDTGCGMGEETLKKLFEPFFTTKEQGKGTGLGLATAYGIVKQHRGWIDVQSSPGKGSRFRVYLPYLASGARAPQTAPSRIVPRSRPAGRETVLLVEDDPIVRTFTGLSLRTCGYTVIEAADGEIALEKWKGSEGRIDLLLSDMVMPRALTGWELARRMREDRPYLAVVLMSGYSSELPKAMAQVDSDVVFLQKPFDTDKLTAALRDALARGTHLVAKG